MNASVAAAHVAPPQTTIADAMALLKAISDPQYAAAWLENVDLAVVELHTTQADIDAKMADLATREAALQVNADNLAKGVAQLASDQAAYAAKASALKAALAG
jgi:hypothetical protein